MIFFLVTWRFWGVATKYDYFSVILGSLFKINVQNMNIFWGMLKFLICSWVCCFFFLFFCKQQVLKLSLHSKKKYEYPLGVIRSPFWTFSKLFFSFTKDRFSFWQQLLLLFTPLFLTNLLFLWEMMLKQAPR